MEQVQALMFDVFGTVVDWRGTIVPELEALGKKHGLPQGTKFLFAYNYSWSPEIVVADPFLYAFRYRLGKICTAVANGIYHGHVGFSSQV